MRILLPLTILLAACTLAYPLPGPDEEMGSSAAMQESSTSATVEGDNISSSPANTNIVERVLPGGIVEIGTRDAPHVMTIFLNLASPYSQQFASDLLPKVEEEFMKDGMLRVELVHKPLERYIDTERDGVALVCAAQQGKARALMAHRTNELDAELMNNCRNELLAQTGSLALQDSMSRSMGIEVVPTFFIGDQRWEGLPEWNELRARIRRAITE